MIRLKYQRSHCEDVTQITWHTSLSTCLSLVIAVTGGSCMKTMTLNFDLDLSEVNGEIWHRFWTNVMKTGLFKKLQRAQRTNERTNKPTNKLVWSQYLLAEVEMSETRKGSYTDQWNRWPDRESGVLCRCQWTQVQDRRHPWSTSTFHVDRRTADQPSYSRAQGTLTCTGDIWPTTIITTTHVTIFLKVRRLRLLPLLIAMSPKHRRPCPRITP